MRIRAARSGFYFPTRVLKSLALAAAMIGLLIPGAAHAWQTAPAGTQSGQKPPDPSSSPEAGGPQGDIGPIAIPKKKEAPPKKEDLPKPPKQQQTPEFSLKVNVPLVTLDVSVQQKDGNFIPGLKKEYFRVLEDGVPQTITDFSQTQAPITAAILVEFSGDTFGLFQRDSLVSTFTFVQTLKKDDWVALISYDIRPHILTDFTQNKNEVMGGLRSLSIAMSSESNLYDALYDTIDRLEQIEGRKYLVLVSSGRDTFSKKNYDHVLKRLQATKDIVIYAVGTGQALREYAESHRQMRALCPMTTFSCGTEFLQYDNAMKTFAKLTGGKAYFPLFTGQYPEVFNDIADKVRNQYSISYHPTNRSTDESFRKIKVELVDDKGAPLKMKDQKGKDVKYMIVHREGYKAKPEVE